MFLRENQPIKLQPFNNNIKLVIFNFTATIVAAVKLMSRPSLNVNKKTSKRFKALPYSTIYLHQESEEFRTAITEIYESVFKDYLQYQKNGHFAKCCWTFGRRELKNKLNHPQEHLLTVKSLIKTNGIKTVEHLEAYLKEILPRNEEDHILKPTVNRWHIEVTVRVQPPLLNLPEPVQASFLENPKESDLSESNNRLILEASNQWKADEFEEKDQFDSEVEDIDIKQLTIDELTQKLKEKDELINEMANDMMNLKEENRSLKVKYDDIKSNEASYLSKITSLELNAVHLQSRLIQKRPPEVNSLFRSAMKKPEVKLTQDLSQRIDRLVKNATMSFGGFNLKKNSNK